MSEFKFACPVCGQHITVDSGSSGKVLKCPTCFRGIVVPQAPSGPDSKLILSGSQVAKPRPNSLGTASEVIGGQAVSGSRGRRLAALVVAMLGVVGASWALRRPLVSLVLPPQDRPEVATAQSTLLMASRVAYTIPTNFEWTLDLTKATIPEAVASGQIGGQGFRCEKASLQDGRLTLRQGQAGPPYIRVSVQLFARQAEELSGKSVEIGSGRRGALPRVSLRVQDEEQPPLSRDLEGGYALKMTFGQAANGKMPGRIYLCLPDAAKSFVAGSFEAEIKKASGPMPRPSTAAR
jgi:hypothetical protein